MIKFKDIKIIAETGLAHDGSYALAASYIHKAKKVGVDMSFISLVSKINESMPSIIVKKNITIF